MEDSLFKKRMRWLYGFIGLAVLVNFSGLGVTILGPDGALYASIAKTMVVSNNYSDLMVEGKDWLDKPHFPFWMAAISFKLFGITTWAYKLPALLFVLMAAVYTYKFAKDLYNKEIGLWAVLILLTATHLMISTNDVRAEPYLTGLIIAAVYHFYKALGKQWFWHLLIASFFAGCAVMTKGIFALIPVAGAIGGHLMLTRQWKSLLSVRWLLAVVLILLFISPELWSLYQQFDLHPEKVVFGRTGVSGLQFFFWDSQFGRFFNTGPIKKYGGDPFFFLHTTLWAFLPWAFLFYFAVVHYLRANFRKVQSVEWYNLGGAGLTFLIFSVSEFQLPHYITIIFPFFAILTAQYIHQLESAHSLRTIRILQDTVISLMALVIILLDFYFHPLTYSVGFMGSSLLCLVLLYFTTVNKSLGKYKVYFQSAVIAFLVNIYFNLAFYPQLTRYQADSEAAFFINEQNKEHLPVVKVLNGYAFAIDFYTRQPLIYYRIGEENVLPPKPYLLYVDSEALPQLAEQGLKGQILKTFERYSITRLKIEFINHKTRAKTLATSQLMLIK